jgi:hypothetical protein
LTLGSAAGGTDLFSQDLGSALNVTATGLPVDGRPIYARIWYAQPGSSWLAQDFTFTAANGGGGGGGATANPQIYSPVPGSRLAGTVQTFQWTAGTGASSYWLYVGDTVGGASYFAQSLGGSLSATVVSLPIDGRTIYARLWWVKDGSWNYADYTFSAAR